MSPMCPEYRVTYVSGRTSMSYRRRHFRRIFNVALFDPISCSAASRHLDDARSGSTEPALYPHLRQYEWPVLGWTLFPSVPGNRAPPSAGLWSGHARASAPTWPTGAQTRSEGHYFGVGIGSPLETFSAVDVTVAPYTDEVSHPAVNRSSELGNSPLLPANLEQLPAQSDHERDLAISLAARSHRFRTA